MMIRAKVFPSSLKNEIVEYGKEYKIYVKERAEDNKANVKVLRLLSKKFGISYKKIKIKNPSSRDKLIEIDM